MSDDTKNQITTEAEYLKASADEIDRLASLGLPVSVDPDITEFMGAMFEDALSVEDALDSIVIDAEIDDHD